MVIRVLVFTVFCIVCTVFFILFRLCIFILIYFVCTGVRLRGADCDTDHYLVIAKVRERLAVGKQAAQRVDRKRFNLSKLNDMEVRKQYQINITNRFAALENLNEDEDVNRTWKNIKENIKTSTKESPGVHEWKQH